MIRERWMPSSMYEKGMPIEWFEKNVTEDGCFTGVSIWSYTKWIIKSKLK